MAGILKGYLLIADITGYTLYLTQSELEHAQEILADLLTVLVARTRPPLVLSRLAGDAVISYAVQENFVQGQTYIEMLEDTYVAFRKALERMVLNNTCRCNACANIARLDLKFFTHYGEFAVQRIHNHDELVGSDVNLLHRLLKNRVVLDTGIQAYSLYTQAAVDQLDIQEICQKMKEHTETYEYLGEVPVWVQDMHPAWSSRRGESRFRLSPQEVFIQWEIDIDLPPEKVWDYLAQPEFRKALAGAERMEVINKKEGRIASGSVYHCFHGKQVTPQTVVDWQPFERIVLQDRLPVPLMDIFVHEEYQIQQVPTGTRFKLLMSRPSGPLPGRWMAERVLRGMQAKGHDVMRSFKDLIERDAKLLAATTLPVLQITAETISQEARSSLTLG